MAFEHQPVDQPLLAVERLPDPRHLLLGDDVGGKLPLDLAEPLVIGVLEGFEGRQEIPEGVPHVATLRTLRLRGGNRHCIHSSLSDLLGE